MYYTWGYIKEATLIKLDMTEKEAEQQGLLRRFPFFANEAMTQICSAVKPCYKFAHVNVLTADQSWPSGVDARNTIRLYEDSKYYINTPAIQFGGNEELERYQQRLRPAFTMPEDFVSFGEDVNRVYRLLYCGRIEETNANGYLTGREIENAGLYSNVAEEANDNDFSYLGYNQIVFFKPGQYEISYNARWFMFTNETPNEMQLLVPIDILDCLPSYIASQCFKADDEVKSSILRNEFEMLMARIDVANPRTTKNIHIDGGW